MQRKARIDNMTNDFSSDNYDSDGYDKGMHYLDLGCSPSHLGGQAQEVMGKVEIIPFKQKQVETTGHLSPV